MEKKKQMQSILIFKPTQKWGLLKPYTQFPIFYYLQLERKSISNGDYNPGQNIWNKIKKSSKTGQKKKSLISTFPSFLTAIAKV